MLGSSPGLLDRPALGEAPAAKQAEQVELALGAHLVERLIVRKVDDLNDQTLA